MPSFDMPAATALALVTALSAHGVDWCVGGGWAIDALLGEQTRSHADLDLWVLAGDAEALFRACGEHGVDRIHPWPGDRPWNFVLHDGRSRRVDLHFYERLDSRLHYGGVADPFVFDEQDLSGAGRIDGHAIRCESAPFALSNHAGYPPRDVDRLDVARLCRRFGLPAPDRYA